jgi:hypothetical protein
MYYPETKMPIVAGAIFAQEMTTELTELTDRFKKKNIIVGRCIIANEFFGNEPVLIGNAVRVIGLRAIEAFLNNSYPDSI